MIWFDGRCGTNCDFELGAHSSLQYETIFIFKLYKICSLLVPKECKRNYTDNHLKPYLHDKYIIPRLTTLVCCVCLFFLCVFQLHTSEVWTKVIDAGAISVELL